jgi:uncharacterized membrane protein SirB2
MLASHFASIRLVHIASVALSGSLFCLRGLMRIAGVRAANHWVLRLSSQLIDSALLTAAILLTLIIHQYPLTDPWLTTKVLLLMLYVVLGTIALKGERTRKARGAAFVSALVVFTYIIGVAITHEPAGWLALIRR